MLTCKDLLAKIYEDDKVELVLEALGCHSIHFEQGGNLIVAGRPEGDNKRAVQVRSDEMLKVKIRTTGFEGDLLDLVKDIMGFEYISEVQTYLMNICGYDENTSYEEPPLNWLNKIKRQRKCYENTYEMPIIDESVLDQFIYGDIEQYNKDGISTETLLEYKIGYDVITKRITTPVRDQYGNLSGVKGRATKKEDEENWKFFYIYKCNQAHTLFNYHKAKDYCELNGEVLLFEAEKSTMQMNDFGIFNTMGIGSSNISSQQLNLLYGLNCDIVLCFDQGLKNIEETLDVYIKFFSGKRNVYTILDTKGLLPEKASPSDCGLEMWEKLYSDKIMICEV